MDGCATTFAINTIRRRQQMLSLKRLGKTLRLRTTVSGVVVPLLAFCSPFEATTFAPLTDRLQPLLASRSRFPDLHRGSTTCSLQAQCSARLPTWVFTLSGRERFVENAAQTATIRSGSVPASTDYRAHVAQLHCHFLRSLLPLLLACLTCWLTLLVQWRAAATSNPSRGHPVTRLL